MDAGMMTIRGTAEEFGVHENTIRNWIKRGIITAIKLPSGVRRIPTSEVTRLKMVSSLPVPTSIVERGEPAKLKFAEPREYSSRRIR
jgi:excisionase family DNA binding protein